MIGENNVDEYILYLDESKDEINNKYFCIGGLIIKKSNVEILESGILEVKRCIWDDEFIKKNSPILHCVEITSIKNSRDNKKRLLTLSQKYPNFSLLSSKSKDEIKQIYDNVYTECCKIIKKLECITIGCLVNLDHLAYLYGDFVKNNRDLILDIAFQEVISNYSHFLHKSNGVGNIVYESRNPSSALTEKSPDFKMFDDFCKIKSCNKGMVFIDEKTLAKTIRYLYIHNKYKNIAGLQLADFISYNFIQNEKISNSSQYTEFMNKINSRLYNGMFDIDNKDLRFYFGLKRVPFDYQRISNLESENIKLKNNNKKLKNEKNKLLKSNKKISESKDKLIHENNELKKIIDSFDK